MDDHPKSGFSISISHMRRVAAAYQKCAAPTLKVTSLASYG
jgi:hypothetical protein